MFKEISTSIKEPTDVSDYTSFRKLLENFASINELNIRRVEFLDNKNIKITEVDDLLPENSDKNEVFWLLEGDNTRLIVKPQPGETRTINSHTESYLTTQQINLYDASLKAFPYDCNKLPEFFRNVPLLSVTLIWWCNKWMQCVRSYECSAYFRGPSKSLLDIYRKID